MENPYEPTAVANDSKDTPVYPLVSTRSVVFLVLMALVGATVGGGLGFMVGSVAPSYYDAVFGVKANHDKVGFGLGVVQGAGAGLLGGLALIAINYFFKYRRHYPNSRSNDVAEGARS